MEEKVPLPRTATVLLHPVSALQQQQHQSIGERLLAVYQYQVTLRCTINPRSVLIIVSVTASMLSMVAIPVFVDPTLPDIHFTSLSACSSCKASSSQHLSSTLCSVLDA
ncbi:hypothetical protein QBC43DRAFT_290164 [Cladorrhinum sp. PSN259]|nr:hypothetical protein QBC43DRAFT_290164 [Cladorrhinum sp. PSN259]